MITAFFAGFYALNRRKYPEYSAVWQVKGLDWWSRLLKLGHLKS